MKFHPDVPKATCDTWYAKHRQKWACPAKGFKGANVTIFWDIEVCILFTSLHCRQRDHQNTPLTDAPAITTSTQNCRPDCDHAALPIDYAEMLRDAFKTSTGASSMKCIASLSKTYPATVPGVKSRPGDFKLGYDQVGALDGWLPACTSLLGC
jgi:hypothetical protein